jgi:hypothetical protein
MFTPKKLRRETPPISFSGNYEEFKAFVEAGGKGNGETVPSDNALHNLLAAPPKHRMRPQTKRRKKGKK